MRRKKVNKKFGKSMILIFLSFVLLMVVLVIGILHGFDKDYLNEVFTFERENLPGRQEVFLSPISSCQSLSVADTVYTLTQNITTTGSCFTITADNVTLNGDGYYVFGDDGISDEGFSATDRNAVTVANISFHNFGRGVEFSSVENSSILNTVINSSSGNGIVFIGNSRYNVIDGNNVTGTASGQLAVSISGDYNNITSNNISKNLWPGLQIVGGGFNLIDSNVFEANDLDGIGTSGGAQNNVIRNNVASGSAQGIRLQGTSQGNLVVGNTFFGNAQAINPTSSASHNIFLNNTFFNNSNAVFLSGTGTKNNSFVNNSFLGSYANDLVYFSTGSNDTRFVNNAIGNFSFQSPGTTFIFEEEGKGKIHFLEAVNGAGNNLSDIIKIDNNFVFVDSDNFPSFNVTSNITFFGNPAASFSDPEIRRNDIACSNEVCYNFTALSSEEVVFNVSYWSNYSLGDITQLSMCGELDLTGRNYTLLNNVSTSSSCFNITANDISLNLQKYNVLGDANSESDYGILIRGNGTRVLNGSIVDFGQGIRSLGAIDSNYSDLQISSVGDFGVASTVYGAFLEGQNNLIANVNISIINNTNAVFSNAYGIQVQNGANSKIRDSFFGSVNSVGGTKRSVNFVSSNASIFANNIVKNGPGVYLQSSNNSLFENNTLLDTETGFSFSGFNNGLIYGNLISNVLGGGISVSSGNRNNLSNNVLVGTHASNGLDITTDDNYIHNNSISNFSLGLSLNFASGNNFSENKYISNENSYSIFPGNTFNSIFENETINFSSKDSIVLSSVSFPVSNITFRNINVVDTNESYHDLKIDGALGQVSFIDTSIRNYSFGSIGGKFIFENTAFGEIRFLENVNGSGVNLSSSLKIGNNSVTVNSIRSPDLNRSANITLYGSPAAGFGLPIILRDSVECTSSVCYNYTSLLDENVIFNVSYWTKYELGDSSCFDLDTENKVYTLSSNISSNGDCFTVKANNVTLNGKGFTVKGSTGYGLTGDGKMWQGLKLIDVKFDGFSRGLNLLNISNSSIEDVDTISNDRGIQTSGATGNNITNWTSQSEDFGLLSGGGTKKNIFNNVIIADVGIRGMDLSGDNSENIFRNLNIDSALSAGIYLASGGVQNNVYEDVQISSISSNGLSVASADATNNTFNNFSVSSSGNDIFVAAGNTGVNIINSGFGSYSFSGAGAIINFENTLYGKIEFLEAISGSGTNLSNDVRIGNNSVIVETSSNSGLNSSANLTLYGFPSNGEEHPAILRDGIECTGSVCYNFTDLKEETVLFNVSYWTNYSIAEGNLDTCRDLNDEGKTYVLVNDIFTTGSCFNITADNVVLDGDGYSITGEETVGNFGVKSNAQSGFTVKNLTIENFYIGGDFSNSDFFEVSENILNSNTFGLISLFGDSNIIRGNLATNSTSYGLWLISSDLNTVSGNYVWNNSILGMFVSGTSVDNKIMNNSFIFNNQTGIFLSATASNNTLEDNNITLNKETGVELELSVSNNSLLNNQIYGNVIFDIEDRSETSVYNFLIYNNSFGEVRWIDDSAGGFLRNLTTAGDLTFPGNITIVNNSAELVSEAFTLGSINSSSNVSLYGLSNLFKSPLIFRNNDFCPSTVCYNYTGLNSGDVVFNVTHWTNYSIGEAVTALSVSLSSNLTAGIFWDVVLAPIFNQSAIGNNEMNPTWYFINVSVEGLGTVDVYVKGNSDLVSAGGDILGLGNETYSFNLTDNTVPEIDKFELTTSFSDNKIGDSMNDGSVIYLKFFLNAPHNQPAGTYNNTLEFKAVPTGISP